LAVVAKVLVETTETPEASEKMTDGSRVKVERERESKSERVYIMLCIVVRNCLKEGWFTGLGGKCQIANGVVVLHTHRKFCLDIKNFLCDTISSP